MTAIPAFNDNYLWLVLCQESAQCIIIDPGDAAPVIQHLQAQQLTLAAILITHHHHDHVGGISRLLHEYPGLPVYGPAGESIHGVQYKVQQGDSLTISALGNVDFKVLDVPGHTLGHIAYYCQTQGQTLLFCGDTLFAAGCGRLFEGTAAQMLASLQKLIALPHDTQVFCAHEYTLQNIAFAKVVEPDNAMLLAREQHCRELRVNNKATIPFRLAEELATNPFLRVHEPSVIQAAEQHCARQGLSAAEVFAVIRSWKDAF